MCFQNFLALYPTKTDFYWLPWQPLSRKIFLNSYQSIFYPDVIFANKNFLTGLEHEIFFLEDFPLFAFPWQQGPKFGHIPTFFSGSVNFSFISIY